VLRRAACRRRSAIVEIRKHVSFPIASMRTAWLNVCSENKADTTYAQCVSVMPEVTIELLDAKSQIIESRMDARVAAINATIDATRASLEAKLDARTASIEAKIGAALVRMDERDKTYLERDESRLRWERGRDELYETRLSNVEDVQRATMAGISNLKNTTIVTAIAAVLGVAAYNAALLSNMQASFQTGKDLGVSLMQTSNELRQISEQLAIEQRAFRQLAQPLK
jgi:ABC-type multidrug transport system fused ATPase/permease subunit